LFDDFVQALVEADLVVLTDVYAAGEAPLAAFDSKALLQAMRLRGHKDNLHVESLEELNELMTPVLLDDDVVLVMGAGDIGQVARQWKEQSA
jgi:UDP-N-acetylmuramate--alanine ligase